ncbi:DUF4287 domain-containing protein [Marinitenerispora sediminis]|uniref:DUF4287 domain-containing protein n=1 Tax=Marinitenerispora sediminis TaxID=1931232 RepID=A0A368TBC9_9ACTN|nr:DUF4287 domain-containing protein [Marinitenerispora sediminis]RCV54414.1 DUF4287 domain-containing protein [Marinitenerispora sediminis]RCV61143.1 DUF4287 domain-containing protein [Marinitenerispora sediminis]RCV62418.1 DUF4287 domain-containing protein [Marinitenerispora sediminis]
MSVTHSPETHALLLARIPAVTGRELQDWFDTLEKGPALTRCSERSNWLADEHGLSHGYASAIVHEFDRRRRNRSGVPSQRS